MKKILSFFLLLAVFSSTFSVQAQSALKIERKTYITTGTRSEAKYYTNKGYAYCITPDRIGADQGTELNYMSNETKGGVLYLLEKSGTSDQDYLKTQLAIWLLRNNYMPQYYVNNPNLDVVKKAKSLATQAAKNSNYQSVEPSIKIDSSNMNLSLTSDGQYYKSSNITITTTGLKSDPKLELVNAPTGSTINNVDIGTDNNTMKKEIVVPANQVTEETSFKLKITATGATNVVERYTTPSAQWQDLVVLIPENKLISKEATFTITPIIRKCEYYNNQYYDKNGNITTQETYELQCKTHTCEKVGTTYFGREGKEVTEENYNLECFTHTCEKIGDKYFGKDGIEVIETDYKAQCEPQQVIVPDTKSTSLSNVISIIIGSVLLGTMLGTITYYQDKRKQNN